MERVADKIIVLACCLTAFAVRPWSSWLLAALLCAVAASAFSEAAPRRLASAPALAYMGVALAAPQFGAFAALPLYDAMRDRRAGVRASGSALAAIAVLRLDGGLPFALLACAASVLLSLRTQRARDDREGLLRLRDGVRESSIALEEKNRGLLERQDMDVRLATLAERGRIAREIHDNVGHLLTRSIMQVEALQVVHDDDDQVKAELAQVGETLHEAMDTVRASVHDLRDDSFDLRAQMEEAAARCPFEVDVEYGATDVPLEVGYCFAAVLREALSNVARHSDASRVRVQVVSYPAFHRLTVHDNGSPRPKAPSQERASGGMGLAAMADRARALGGYCSVGYDQGFKVLVTVPREVSV